MRRLLKARQDGVGLPLVGVPRQDSKALERAGIREALAYMRPSLLGRVLQDARDQVNDSRQELQRLVVGCRRFCW